MAASHQAARLAAASLHLPVNPTTQARVAQYEREDPVQALVAAAALEEEEPEQVVRPTRALPADHNINFSEVDKYLTYKDLVNCSDIYHSNEEYFRKLEELKAAHVQSMAKLEKMYQDKLNLKEVQPMLKGNSPSVSSSSVSEKNSSHPILLVTSLSEPDLGRSPSLYTSSSEEELPNVDKESSRRNRMMTYAKELINNMWTDFSVEDYLQSEDADLETVEKPGKKPKEWVPTITVPVPFQMMIREQKKKEEAMKSRSDIEMGHKLLKKQEDSECKKKFRANPVPAYVLLPLYQDIVKQNEERRRTMKEKNKEALLALQKPFKFIAREQQKQAAREKQLKDFLKSKKKAKRFKARPIPRSIYGSSTSDKLKEDDFYRNIRMQLRAQELSQNSSPLPCSPCRRFRNPSCLEKARKLRCNCQERCQAPHVDDLPEKNKDHFSEHKCPKFSTVHKRFDLHSSSSESAKREKILADIRADEENLKETRWPYLSPRLKSPVKSMSAKPMLYNYSPPMPTASSQGREQAIRRSLEEKKMLEEERNRILTKQKQRMKELQKLLTTRAKAYDSHQSLAQISKSKVKYFRYHERILKLQNIGFQTFFFKKSVDTKI